MPRDSEIKLREFEKVFQDTHRQVRAFMAGLGVSRDEIDDIAQDVYIAFYKGMDKMPPDLLPIRWLKGIARKTCLNHFRRAKRKHSKYHELLSELLAQTKAATIERPLITSNFHRLHECMSKLSENHRRILLMKYAEDLGSESIAEKTKMKAGAVRMALLRIREAVKRCLLTGTSQEVVYD